MHFTRQASPDSQGFAVLRSPDLVLVHVSYRMFFLKKLSAILSAIGFLAKGHACHSFRRGGASFAFCSGVSVKLIKMLGDWHSDAVLLYLTVPLAIRLQSVNTIAKSILTTNISTPQPTQFGSGVLLVLLAVSF